MGFDDFLMGYHSKTLGSRDENSLIITTMNFQQVSYRKNCISGHLLKCVLQLNHLYLILSWLQRLKLSKHYKMNFQQVSDVLQTLFQDTSWNVFSNHDSRGQSSPIITTINFQQVSCGALFYIPKTIFQDTCWHVFSNYDSTGSRAQTFQIITKLNFQQMSYEFFFCPQNRISGQCLKCVLQLNLLAPEPQPRNQRVLIIHSMTVGSITQTSQTTNDKQNSIVTVYKRIFLVTFSLEYVAKIARSRAQTSQIITNIKDNKRDRSICVGNSSNNEKNKRTNRN